MAEHKQEIEIVGTDGSPYRLIDEDKVADYPVMPRYYVADWFLRTIEDIIITKLMKIRGVPYADVPAADVDAVLLRVPYRHIDGKVYRFDAGYIKTMRDLAPAFVDFLGKAAKTYDRQLKAVENFYVVNTLSLHDCALTSPI